MPQHHPRWAAIASFALLVTGSACGPSEPDMKIGDRTYLVPPGHLASRTVDPHTFIRIAPPDAPFDIVYDSRSEHERDKRGRPRIFGLNDEKAPDIVYYRTSNRLVVCRRAVHPKSGCGTKVKYGGANWSILYPEGRIGETEKLVQQAVSLLRGYERQAR